MVHHYVPESRTNSYLFARFPQRLQGRLMARGIRSLDEVRRATVAVIDARTAQVVGHGLALPDEDGATAVLTCFHVAAFGSPQHLRVAFADADGHLGEPHLAFFDDERCDPLTDTAVLRVDREPPGHPLLHRLDPARHTAALEHRVIGSTWMQPATFEGVLGPASALEVSHGPDHFRLEHAFAVRQASDSRPGLSGAPVCCEEGVLGLAHFGRDESPCEGREMYVVPLAVWAAKWPSLADRIEPLIDRRLLGAARVVRASDLAAGLATNLADPELTIASYRPDVYVPHPAAQDAAALLEERGRVLIIGRPMAGKTRLALELANSRPGAWVVIPEAVAPPADFERAGLSGELLILLADDLHNAAARPDIFRWRRALSDGGADVRVIATSRDGEDFGAVRTTDPRMDARFADVDVWLSAGPRAGADFPLAEARQLGDHLDLPPELVDARFDGTPGSLTLDVTLMRDRYERLRDTEIGAISAGRLLESLRLFMLCGQEPLTERAIRDVAENVRGSAPISAETWDALCRATSSAGFGAFVDGVFKTYLPLLERAVTFEPTEDEYRHVAKRFVEARDWSAVFSLAKCAGVAPWVRLATLDDLLASEQDEQDEQTVPLARLFRAVAFHDMDDRDAAITALEEAREGPNPGRADEAALFLGLYLQEWGRDEDAMVAAWRSAVDSTEPGVAAQAQARLGMLLLERGEHTDAEPLLRAAAASDHSGVNAVAAYNLANSVMSLRADDKRALLLRAVELRDRRVSPAAALSLAMARPDAETWQAIAGTVEEAARGTGEAADMAAVLLAFRADDEHRLDVDSALLWRAALREPPYAITPSVALLLGRRLVDRGRHQEGIKLLERARALHPADPPGDLWASLGIGYAEVGRLEEALEALRKAVEHEQEPGISTYNLGVVESRLGRAESGLRNLERVAASADPGTAARAAAAIAQQRAFDRDAGNDADGKALNDAIAALTDLSAHLDEGGEHASVQYGLAQALVGAGRTDEAISAFEMAIRSERSWTLEAKMQFARLLLDVGQKDRADRLLEEIAAAGDEQAAYFLAKSRVDAGEHSAAMPFLRIGAKSADPEVSKASRFMLAMELPNAGAWREALGRHQQLIDEADDPRVASGLRHSMALVFAEREQWEQAAELWHQIGQARDVLELVNWRHWLGYSYLQLERYDEGRSLLLAEIADPAAGLRSDSATALGQAAVARSDIVAGRLALGFLIDAADSRHKQRAQLMLGVLEDDAGDPAVAERLWTSAAEGADQEAAAAALTNLAILAESRDDWPGSVGFLRRAAGLDSTELATVALVKLAEGELEHGRLDEAISVVGLAVKRDVPSVGTLVNTLAQALIGQDRLDEARAQLDSVLDADDLTVRRDALELRGELEWRDGQLEAALSCYDRVAEIDGPDRMAMRAGAEIARMLGDLPGALARFRSAAESAEPRLADEAWLNIGDLLVQTGDLQNAKAALSRASGSSDPAVVVQAQEELLLVAVEEADVETVKQQGPVLMAQVQPESQARIAHAIGTFWVQRGDALQAEQALTTAIDSGIAPWDAAAAINLAALFERSDFERARATLAPFAAGDGPMRWRVRLALAQLLAINDQLDDAAGILDEIMTALDDDLAGEAAIAAATVHGLAGRYDRVVMALDHPRARADPQFAGAVLALMGSDDQPIIAEHGERLLRMASDGADEAVRPMLTFALAHVVLSSDPAAVTEMLDALVTHPELGAVASALSARAHERLGEPDAAAAHWERAFAADPVGQADAALNAGAAYAELGRTADAERLWRSIVQDADNDIAGTALLNLGVVRAEADPAGAAQLWIEAAAKGNTTASEYLDVLRDQHLA